MKPNSDDLEQDNAKRQIVPLLFDWSFMFSSLVKCQLIDLSSIDHSLLIPVHHLDPFVFLTQ